MVLLPTPPFALLTAMTLLTFGMGRFSGRPDERDGQRMAAECRGLAELPLFIRAARFGGVPERGRPFKC